MALETSPLIYYGGLPASMPLPLTVSGALARRDFVGCVDLLVVDGMGKTIYFSHTCLLSGMCKYL